MDRIIVIGCPGSGKSTFSKELSKILGVPLWHLDLLYWNEDKTTVCKELFVERLAGGMKKEKWIIDGNYGSTMEMRMKECDTVIFLDYPLELCLQGIKDRQGKKRSDMPWVETETDFEFVDYVKNFKNNGRKQITELLNKYSNKRIYAFTDRLQAEEFLMKLR